MSMLKERALGETSKKEGNLKISDAVRQKENSKKKTPTHHDSRHTHEEEKIGRWGSADQILSRKKRVWTTLEQH